jgi:hypothetical protein
VGIVRNILAVIAGYLIFAVSAVLLFQLSGIDPHTESGFGTILLVVAFGSVFSFIGGFAAKAIAATNSLVVNLVLAVLMAGFAAFSMVKSPGTNYTQIAAITVFAPLSLLGGYIRKRETLRS